MSDPTPTTRPAVVTGILEIRDKDGNVKSRVSFTGTTPLTESELRAALNTPKAE